MSGVVDLSEVPEPGEVGPSHTYRIFEALKAAPDFLNKAQLMKLTGANVNQVSAALFQLRRHQAVDVVVEADGTGWWFATPETDLRSKRVDVRVAEAPGSRHRLPKPRLKVVRGPKIRSGEA